MIGENPSIVVQRSVDCENPLEHPVFCEASKIARKMREKAEIDPANFSELYGEENVKRDADCVKKLEEKFEQCSKEEKTAKKCAEVLEMILFEHAELSEWFGSLAETVKTSRYDDYKNKADLIVEFHSEEAANHLALSVDATFSARSVMEKIQNIKERIETDDESKQLGRIKYFEDSKRTFKGELKKVPQVVVGLEKQHLMELAGLWVQSKGRYETLAKKAKKDIAAHPAQTALLGQVLMQLSCFEKYSEKIGRQNLAVIFRRGRRIVEKILSEKQQLGTITRWQQMDKITQALQDALKTSFN